MFSKRIISAFFFSFVLSFSSISFVFASFVFAQSSPTDSTLKEELNAYTGFPDSLLCSKTIPEMKYGRGSFRWVWTTTYLTGSNTLERMEWPADSSKAAAFIWWAFGYNPLEVEVFNRIGEEPQRRGEIRRYKVPGKDGIVTDTVAFDGAPVTSLPEIPGWLAQVNFSIVPAFESHWARQPEVNRIYIEHLKRHLDDVNSDEREELTVRMSTMRDLFKAMVGALRMPTASSSEEFIDKADKAVQKAGQFKDELIACYQWALRWDREFHERNR